MRSFYFFVGLLSCFWACQSPQPPAESAYYWKTTLDISEAEKEWLIERAIRRLYVRFFDVDIERGQLQPIAILQNIEALPDSLHVVPVVFITNRSLANRSSEEMPALADSMLFLIQQLLPKKQKLTHLQLDCDWNQASRPAYFRLLDAFREKVPQLQELSVTLRLHQLRYPQQTGIPPADKAVLMYYNMSNVRNPDTQNSIIDNKVGASYLEPSQGYPLPMDVALPLFSWSVVFRDGKLVHLIPSANEQVRSDRKRFVQIDSTHFVVRKGTYLEAVYLYPGDEIRLEASSFEDLKEAIVLLKQYVNDFHGCLIYYHLDQNNLQHFESTDFEQLSNLLAY